jgi:DNA-directed RNA polymerase subunit RPC12/RpoP
MEKGEVCQLCGKKSKLDKHHLNYEENITLSICKKCHRSVHSLQRNTLPLKTPINLFCYHCNHKWIYRGRNPFYATCPSCYYKVNINKMKGGKT